MPRQGPEPLTCSLAEDVLPEMPPLATVVPQPPRGWLEGASMAHPAAVRQTDFLLSFPPSATVASRSALKLPALKGLGPCWRRCTALLA